MMEAKARGAQVVHIDPRFTRTSAVADRHVPLRAGSDIAFLGGVINYILTNELDFREYVAAYTNAATSSTKGTGTPRTWTGSSAATTTRPRTITTVGPGTTSRQARDGRARRKETAPRLQHGSGGAPRRRRR